MGRREENKRRKHEALLAAGLAAFEADGYERASIETIVREAGVARGTFYLYFEDKLALFRALVLPWTDALAEVVGTVDRTIDQVTDRTGLAEVYEGMALQIAMLGLTHSQVILLVFRELRGATEAGAFLRDQEARLLGAAVQITAHARDRGLIRVKRPEVVARMVLGATERMTFDLLTGADLGPPLEVAAEVVELFSAALLQEGAGSEDPDAG